MKKNSRHHTSTRSHDHAALVVFHDPEQRDKMSKALQSADYRWVGAAILAYILVEISAAVRLADFAPRSGHSTQFFRLAALFLNRHVFTTSSCWRHRRPTLLKATCC